MPYGDRDTVDRVLALPTWAVVGLSTNPRRAAHGVASFLQTRGRRIVPVHPHAETVHGEQGYAALDEIPFAVDVVDLFIRSELARPVVDAAIANGATAIWMPVSYTHLTLPTKRIV